ncbi:MAG: protein-tyrosine kinase [Lachnospiraceae bacterium]|nr:protein-tyrosine kinase [Lachnospiraceae bacterium]
MDTREKESMEMEIDILEVARYLLRKAWLIALVGFVCAVVAYAYTKVLVVPQYKSTTRMYVINRQNESTVTSSDLQSSNYMAKDNVALLTGRTVIEGVIEEMNLDMTYEQMLSKISVSNLTDTRLVVVSVSDADPLMAMNIANKVCELGAKHIENVVKVAAVSVADEANLPKEPYSPSTLKNVMLAALLGAFAVAAVLVVKMLLNDKIVTAEDVDKYLGISVLGILPIDEEIAKAKKARKRNKRRK